MQSSPLCRENKVENNRAWRVTWNYANSPFNVYCLGYSATVSSTNETARTFPIFPAAWRVEGDGYSLQSDGHDDGSTPSPRHSSTQDDAGQSPGGGGILLP